MDTDLDWDALRSFLAVVRAGRLTVAARRLSINHSTLSRRVAGLEHVLQAQLFHRSPAGYALTDRGQLLLQAAEDMEGLAHGAVAALRSSRLRIAGQVRIGAPDGFGVCFLAPRLFSLADAHPGLELQLVTLPRVASLSKREADIAISLAPPTEGRLHARRLTDYQLGLYAARSHLNGCNPIRCLADLPGQRFVGYINDLISMPELDYLPLIDPDPNADSLKPTFSSSNLLAQLYALRAGGGFGVLPCFMGDADPTLARVLPREVALNRSFWLIMHADMRELARIRVTADFIAREVRGQRDSFNPVGVAGAPAKKTISEDGE